MTDPITIAAITKLIVTSAPSWLGPLRDTLLKTGEAAAVDKGKDFATKKGTRYVHDMLHLDEKEQLHHLEAALKNAVKRGLSRFQALEQRDQYRDILAVLFEPGAHSDALRREALRLLTLSEAPKLAELNEIYNRSLRIRTLTKTTPPTEVDAAPYLSSFFNALIEELYADPFFRQQMGNILQLRSLTEVSLTLQQISERPVDNYTTEEFERDLETYTIYMERTLRYLKLVGIVPRDRSTEHTDPELNAIFVPLYAAPEERTADEERTKPIIAWLERYPCLVLLGGPGSGKSTAIRYLSWSHAAVNLKPPSVSSSSVSLLSGKPLPLRIELRRLTEDRRQHLHLDFLSYATDSLLGRAGYHVHRKMFEELLERRFMFCLFDGLDEVVTLDERRRLIDEIEDFAQRYPGNRILVTSRPVGYKLARFSSQTFFHVLVQEFDNRQIRMFLERWYAHVLKLAPLLPDDQRELETLYTTLKDNPRLHTLAANPLLLTVITALHRYERLPDRRILVYDKCAELLLDTWAKLKGTDVRWNDIKMGKDDQYACVAHLGFVLHKRSQERKEGGKEAGESSSAIDLADDVPTRFMLKEIELFLKSRGLLSELAEQRAEAGHFLDLIQEEAGLIVERGKDESGQGLYGFVHRTFQEYFAAADVYERYLQEEDPSIISLFIKENLHDPHWHEVILLLLGKLKRKPAAIQLRQLLDGKSRLSKYTELLQQDLFFICSCLAEEIAVDIELADSIALQMSGLVKNSPFPSQREKAMKALASLMKTRLYADLGHRELKALIAQDTLDVSVRALAAQILYRSYTSRLEEQQLATQKLVELMQQPDLSVEQRVDLIKALYRCSSYESQERRLATQKLVELMQQPGFSIEWRINVVLKLEWYNLDDSSEELLQIIKEMGSRSNLILEQRLELIQLRYYLSGYESEEREQVSQKLVEILQQPDLSVEQRAKVALALYSCVISDDSELEQQTIRRLAELIQGPDLSIEQSIEIAQALCYLYGLQEQQLATQKLVGLMQQPDLSVKQHLEIAQALYDCSLYDLHEQQLATQKLVELMQQPDLSVEQCLEIAQALYRCSSYDSHEQQLATQKLVELMQQPDLSVEQRLEIAQALYRCSLYDSREQQLVTQKLVELVQQPDLSVEQHAKLTKALYECNYGSREQRQATQKLRELMQRPKLPLEQHIEVIDAFYNCNLHESQERQQITQKLSEMVQQPNLSVEEYVEIARVLSESSSYRSQERHQVIQKLFEVMQQPDLSVEQAIEVAQVLYQCSAFRSKERQLAAHKLLELMHQPGLSLNQRTEVASVFMRHYGLEEQRQVSKKAIELMRQPDLSVEQHLEMVEAFYHSILPLSMRSWLTQKLMEMAQRSDFTVEQAIEVAQTLYRCSSPESTEKQWVNQKLVEILQQANLSVEQRVKAAEALYNCSPQKSEERQQVTQQLVALLQPLDLTVEQRIEVAGALYRCSPDKSEERWQSARKLLEIMREISLPADQRLRTATVFLTATDANYSHRAQSVQTVFGLTDEETAKFNIQKYWRSIDTKSKVEPSEISSLVKLVNDKRLPNLLRNEMYTLLENMIPEFGNIAVTG